MKQNINYIIVNYHYVRAPSAEWGGIWPCSPDEFEKQVSFFAKNYRLSSVDEVFSAAQKNILGKYCAITFDDGLKDQYENSVPILKKYGATATFFIITATLNGFLPAAHKLHVLLSKTSAEDLINLFHDFQEEIRIPFDRRLKPNKRLFEEIPVANLKETLIGVSEEMKEKFLDECFKKSNLDSEAISKSMFMDEAQIISLYNLGFEIGSHSHHHYFSDEMGRYYLKSDVSKSRDVLEKITGFAPSIFSYPHGRYGKASQEVLKETDFKHAVTIERRGVYQNENSYLIPRFDTMDFKTISIQ